MEFTAMRGSLLMPKGGGVSSTRGFTLLELALVLIVIGLITAAGAFVLPWTRESQSLDKTRQVMAEASTAILAFSLTNNRLPCPADPALTVGDANYGKEDCSLAVGVVPHEALLLSGPVFDTAHRAVVYSVYRNASTAADLATAVNLFDGVDEPDSVVNVYDFCQALKNADASAGTGYTSVSTSTNSGGCAAGNDINQAFILVSGGLEDADGDGKVFDGDNADSIETCFASPQRGRSASYDDIVTAVSFSDILAKVCP